MTLDTGTKLGSFEITSLLGKGGMGEVYRARDTRLGREVAIKVLGNSFADDPDMLARFEREALHLARLDHPRIGSIYDFQQIDGVNFLVMQLVEGESLAQRIQRGPVPPDEAISIFTQVAEGLEAAHEAGIVHRDLKPANIVVGSDDAVKVLDFGIAKRLDANPISGTTPTPNRPVDPNAPTRPISPTPSSSLTADGTFIGTPHYMAPEQARGKAVDRRADIWAFGVCLYEALTAKRPFEGETVTDILSSIIRDQPDLDRLPASTPHRVRELIDRCMTKNLKYRLRDIGEAWIQLSRTDDGARIGEDASGSGALLRFKFGLPDGRVFSQIRPAMSVSPDGKTIAMIAERGGVSRLYIRHLHDLDLEHIPFSDPRACRFTPDGEWLLVMGEKVLSRLRLSDRFCERIYAFGIAPSEVVVTPRGKIVWSTMDSGLRIAQLGGSETRDLTSLGDDGPETQHRACGLSPDGNWILTTIVHGPDEPMRLEWISPDTGERRVAAERAASGFMTHNGDLFFGRGRTLMRAPTKGDPPMPAGPPISVVSDLGGTLYNEMLHYSVSDSGLLVYSPRPQSHRASKVYTVSRKGDREALPLPDNTYLGPRCSPDGEACAFVAADPNGTQQSFLYDLERGTLEQLTHERAPAVVPVWHPDGDRIMYTNTTTSPPSMEIMHLDDDSVEAGYMASRPVWPSCYSPDGEYLLYVEWDDISVVDIFALDSKGNPEPLVQNGHRNICPRFSPDGDYFAYAGDDSGQWQVYIRPFGRSGRRRQVSLDGGIDPVWAPDGSELFYRHGETLYAVQIQRQPRFKIGRPKPLFDFPFDPAPSLYAGVYDIHPDGDRFVITDSIAQAMGSEEVVVVQNWQRLLDKRD